MSIHSRRASAANSPTEGYCPCSPDDLSHSLTHKDMPHLTRAASILGHDSQVVTAGQDQITAHVIDAALPLETTEEKLNGDDPGVEESEESRLERLGRQMPEVFGSIWSEIGFIFSVSMSQVLTV
jgi:hypothetical protein